MYAEIVTSLETRKLNKYFTYLVPVELEHIIAVGQTVIIPFGKNNKMIKGCVLNIKDNTNINKENLKFIDSIDYSQTTIDKSLLALALRIKDYYFLSLASILKLMNIKIINYNKKLEGKTIRLSNLTEKDIFPLRKSNKKLLLEYLYMNGSEKYESLLKEGIKKDTIRKNLKEKLIEVINNRDSKNNCQQITLNKEQDIAFKEIEVSIKEDKKDVFLLRGVTGSGKTEIYFKAIEACLKEGKQVLVLMPEINLTEEMIDRFEKIFPDNVVRWHSKVSKGDKKNTWDEIVNFSKNIIIGPRSAVFTTFNKLGLIIVDEEHDSSYYQSCNPIYNAKDIAILRAQITGSTIVLGSATPSITSYYLARTGKYRLLEINNRYYGQKDPNIEIIDMAQELISGNFSIISNKLKEKILETLNEGEKVILYLNRRGFYNFIICRDCGYVPSCLDCKIPLIYHEKENSLVCHYCGYTQKNINFCPKCSGKRIRGIGVGTEKIVRLIREIFHQCVIERLDSDLSGGIEIKKKIIKDFKNGAIDILVGTQILSKGLDFPNVSLIGVILGDITLNIPDFRAREWTYQSMMQIIGRTGRRNKKGAVFLQTYQPFDIIYDEIKNFNYESYYQKEIAFREKLNYPPFSEIFVVNLLGKEQEAVVFKIWNIFKSLKKIFYYSEIYKPKKSRIEKINGMYKWQIVIKTKDKKKIKRLIETYNDIFDNLNVNFLFYIERNPQGY